MKLQNIILTFKDKHEQEIYASVSDILQVGTPIDEETGDDLELVGDQAEFIE